MSQHFEIRAQDIYFDDDGVIRCVIKPSIHLELEDAHEVIRLLATVSGGRARPVLVDVGPLRSINRDCRRYFAGPETAKVQAAAALLVKSPLARAMGNFFMGLNKPLFPTRLFTVEEEALTWLRKFLGLSLLDTLGMARALIEQLAGRCPGGPTATPVPIALAQLDRTMAEVRDNEVRLDSVVEMLYGLAALDVDRRSAIRGDGSVLDGVIGGINMLGEELSLYVEERGRVERDLEDRVAERTRALTSANLALQNEMIERRRVENELGMAHKLEAVGRLASGVAHEINTPVQFVSDSVQFVQAAFTDLSSVVDQMRAVNHSVVDQTSSRDAAARALAAGEAAELDYLLEQAPIALSRALDGLSHVASIVRSMKAFAHPDAQDMSSVDLNRAIESTLVMARNEYKYVADVVTEFSELPPVICYPGEINQALLNIIVNAAHAIADALPTPGARGRITITTRRDGAQAVVSISDTGVGIPDEIRSRIFDPFFTTKVVGRGTGQGLVVVRSVVEKHAGSLTVDSVVGRGSTFVLRLPIGSPGSASA